MKLFIQW